MKDGINFTKKTLILFIIPFFLIIFAFIRKEFLFIAIIFDLILIFVILLDFFLSPNYKKNITIDLIIEKDFRINCYNHFKILVDNKNKLSVNFYFLTDLDFAFDREYSKKILKVEPSSQKEIELKIFAKRRGLFEINNVYIKGKSLFGFIYFFVKISHKKTFRVIPLISRLNENFKIVQKQIKLNESIQKTNVVGDGLDFEMLRDYIKGDDINKIDWKATARRVKPITRVFRMENSLDIAIMLDCGRIMSTEVDGMSLLDYAINSSIILSYSAVFGGDKVSLLCFGEDIIKYIPPTKNKKDIKNLSVALSGLEYQYVESNYQTAFGFIKNKLSKRSLVIIFTDIIDDSNIKIYHKYLSILSKKHIVLLILLKDKELFEIADTNPSKRLNIFTKTATYDMILRRDKTIHNLKRLGVDVLDLFPEEINPSLLSKYVEIKNRY